MSEVQQFPLAELARFQRGVTWSKAQEIDDPEPGAVPVLRIPNIKERLDTSDLIYLRGVKKSSIDQCAAAKDWVLMVGSNGNPDRVGNCVLIKETNEFLFASFLVGIEPTNRQRITPDFLFRVLRGPEIQRFISDDVQGSTGLSNINLARLKAKVIACPPLPQQRRIVEILSTLDEAIEQTEMLIAKHQQIKAGLMHDLFTRGVAPDGHLRPTREQAPDLYKESPLGWMPKEWAVVTTEDCAAKVPGSTTIGPFGSDLVSSDYRNEGVPVVFVRDIKEDAFEWNSDVFVTHEKAHQLRAHAVRPGDLLSTKMGLPPCVCCEYPNWMEEGIITADIIRLRPDSTKINTRWLSAALNSDAFKGQVQAITAGVTRPKVTLSDFRKLRLARPELDEQKLFANRLASLVDLLSSEEAKLAKLHKQKRGLMHDLLTGHVRVKFSEKRDTRG